MKRKKFIFLDKDGTFIQSMPFNTDPELIELLPASREGVMCTLGMNAVFHDSAARVPGADVPPEICRACYAYQQIF